MIDLKAGDVQDAQEGGALAGATVQGSVEAQDQPAEEALVGGLGQGLQRKVSLQVRAHSEGPACTLVPPDPALPAGRHWVWTEPHHGSSRAATLTTADH